MSYVDLIIIYLACGAPVAVGSSFRTREASGPAVVARCVGAGLAWPVIVSGYLISAIRQRGKRPSLDLKILDEIMHIGREVESALPRTSLAERRFEAQDTFIRYAGLFVETKSPSGSQPDTELAIIAGHNLPGIAEACFSRRNRARLDRAFANARAELFNLIDLYENSPQLLDRVLAGVRLIGDTQTEQSLLRRIDNSRISGENTSPRPLANAA